MSSVRDVVLIGVLVFTIGIMMFIFHFVATTMTDSFLAVPKINETSESRQVFEYFENISVRFDYIVLVVFIALALAMVVSGYMVGGHPIFMFFYFIVTVVAVVISTILANTWETVTQASAFGLTITHFPLANHLILFLPIYVAVVGVIGVVVMFGKPGGSI